MGFLDMFDSPNILSTILGTNGNPSGAYGSMGVDASAQPQPAPPPAPGGSLGPMAGNPMAMAPPPVTGAPGINMLGNPETPTSPVPLGPDGSYGGGPDPRPIIAPPPAGSAAAATAPGGSYGGGPDPREIPTRVGPIQAERIMQPPPSTYDGRPPTSTNGSLEAALGYEGRVPSPANPLVDGRYGMPGGPNPRVGNAVTAGLAGLGRGLTAVGQAPRGASGAQMAALGAGGGLEGGMHQLNVDQAQRRQAQIDAFNMSSGAFKDWIAARHADNEDVTSRARADWLRAGAQYRLQGGKDAFSGTSYAKSRDLERALDQEDDRERKTIKDEVTEGVIDSNEAKDRYAKIRSTRDARRTSRAQILGIEPNAHLQGTDKDHAFDFDKLTPQQREQIPDGAHFKWKDPKTGETKYDTRSYINKPPFEGWTQPNAEQHAPPAPAVNNQQAYDALYGDGTAAPTPSPALAAETA